jgi:hypothetical protein
MDFDSSILAGVVPEEDAFMDVTGGASLWALLMKAASSPFDW